MQAVSLDTNCNAPARLAATAQAQAKFGNVGDVIPHEITSLSGMGEVALFGVILSAGFASGKYLYGIAAHGMSLLWNNASKKEN